MLTVYVYDLEEKLNLMQRIRRKAGYSQQRLADLLGVNRSRVSSWERGHSLPRGRTLIRLSRLIDCMQVDAYGKEGK